MTNDVVPVILLIILVLVAMLCILSRKKERLSIDIPVYLISLPEDSDRRSRICSIITPDIIHSVNGRRLSREKLVDDGIVADEGMNMKLGEYGCYLSHYEIFEKILKADAEYALVLEDDAHFDINEVSIKINQVIANIDKEDWDIIMLAHNYYIKEESEDTGLNVGTDSKLFKIGYLHGAQGYLVNKRNLSTERFLPIKRPLDVDLPSMTRCFVLEPSVIKLSQDAGRSSTQGIN